MSGQLDAGNDEMSAEMVQKHQMYITGKKQK